MDICYLANRSEFIAAEFTCYITSYSGISLLSTDLSDTVGGAGYGSSVTDVTGGLYEMPFDGCIRDISINTHNSEQLTQYTTTNVQSCNS